MSVLCEHTRAISTDSWPDHTFQTQWRALTSVSNVSWRYISGARCHAYDDGREEVKHRRRTSSRTSTQYAAKWRLAGPGNLGDGRMKATSVTQGLSWD
jgi:hypothetical protein